MELFDMVKAAPPPQTISAPERKSTPSPIPPDSPDAIDAADDDGLESVTINDGENEDERKKDNNKRKAGTGAGKEDTDDDEDDSSPFKIPTNSQMNSSLLTDQQEASSSSKIQKKLKKFKQLDDAEKQEETPSTSNKSATFKVPQTPEALEEKEEPKRTKAHKKSATEELEDNGDSDGSQDGHRKSMPTKTKAQQKMFSDLPDPSPNFDRVLVVRIRRLKQSEIDAASASLLKSKFADHNDSSASRKRGRPRKSLNDKKAPSPAKKLKTTPSPKIHIKVPLQSGGKKRGLQQQLARNRTPPPRSSMLKAPKRSNSKTLPPKAPKANPELVERYGAHFFSCLVRVKRTPWPSKSPERNPRPSGLGGVHKGRAKKSNLSVSFSEAVEILGSNEGGSRRSTFGTISSKSPKPTRLQRVDATGNVLEDIALTSNLLFSGNSPSASTSGASGSRGKSKRRSCNGSPRLKRPHQRIPLSGLASLRLDDGPKSDGDDDDEEYIVPNELPGMQRPGTPTPKKKKISFTTTISDDEDEKPPPKKSKDAPKRGPKPKPKPSPKTSEKSALKESILQKGKLQAKTNEVVKELPKKAVVADVVDDQVGEKEAEKVPETKNKEEGDGGEEAEDPKPVDIAKDKPQEDVGETAALAETDIAATQNVGEGVEENAKENAEGNAKESVEENAKESVEESAKENAEENSKASVDFNESQEMSALEVTQTETEEVSQNRADDDDKKQEEAKDVEEDFRELDTPTSQPLPPTTEENQDDVLEIQTSLEDVRQLHTPFLSQESTPNKRVRLDSGDSECSFKSASEENKEAMGRVNAEGDEAAGEVDADAAPGGDKSPGTLLPVSDIDSAAMPAVLITPPSVPRTVNGSDPTNGESGITAACYSPIEAMPTLDDEVLEQLVEPDFQLNSSRHAISRGTLDDIMTALES